MPASLAARLPGVYFETVPERPADDLPRMDVAAFVGFAASGPLHAPVAIEDVGRFRDVFGGELTLAWDEERGEAAIAWLAPAVEAFFRNGGRRCWAVRVADETAARTLEFEVPGLVTPGGGAAAALARSPGAWASALRLGTVLERERFPLGGPLAEFDNGRWTVLLAQSPRILAAGDLLEAVFEDEGLVLFLFVDEAEATDGVLRVSGARAFWRRPAPAGSPPSPIEIALGAGNPTLEALDAAGTAELEALAAGSPGLAPAAVHRLTFDLLAWRGASIERRLAGLAFAAEHARFWAALPSDAGLFRHDSGRSQSELTLEEQLLRAEAALPRFPFSGPVQPEGVYLPLGMTDRPGLEAANPPDLPAGLTALEIDGLAEFDDRLFLDASLTRSYIGSLRADAEHKHGLAFFENGAPLRGMHSLLPVQEVSMIAVPDAAQRAWTRLPPEVRPPLEAPSLDPVGGLDEHGRALLMWTSVEGATAYRLEADRCRNFSNPAAVPASQTGSEALFAPPEDCPRPYFFRVRAERGGETSAWSNSRAAVLPPDEFRACETPRVEVADLMLSAVAAGSPDQGAGIAWDYEDAVAFDAFHQYDLQLSYEPGFEAPEAIVAGDEGYDPEARAYFPGLFTGGSRHYRVRAVRDGKKGVWSNTVTLHPAARSGWTLLPEAEYEPGTLSAVQRALVRFCAARADAVALLSLPRFYREAGTVQHLGDLLPRIDPRLTQERAAAGVLGVPALTQGETGALSYAAIYHPWVAVAQAAAEDSGRRAPRVVWQPPDGPAAGRIAARTLRLGAWTAPANEPIAAAVALDPEFSRESWGRLTASQFNLVVRDSRGFVIFNAETLSRADDLRPLNVRRLMILLRRLALREGETFVFEPHSGEFRSLVRQRFERALSVMYLRGAFAGATPEAGFRVVVDESVNPPRAVETGRFMVELRVAPSQPFRYLTVRLEQASPEKLTVTEE